MISGATTAHVPACYHYRWPSTVNLIQVNAKMHLITFTPVVNLGVEHGHALPIATLEVNNAQVQLR